MQNFIRAGNFKRLLKLKCASWYRSSKRKLQASQPSNLFWINIKVTKFVKSLPLIRFCGFEHPPWNAGRILEFLPSFVVFMGPKLFRSITWPRFWNVTPPEKKRTTFPDRGSIFANWSYVSALNIKPIMFCHLHSFSRSTQWLCFEMFLPTNKPLVKFRTGYSIPSQIRIWGLLSWPLWHWIWTDLNELILNMKSVFWFWSAHTISKFSKNTKCPGIILNSYS